jgi:alkylhydroperoxidase family enzyme
MSDVPEVRIPSLPVEEWSAEALEILPGHLRRPEIYLPMGPDKLPMPRVMGVYAHNPRLGSAWMAFTEVLAGEHATLPAKHTELVILRVAWQTRSEYEWRQHCRMGTHAGLTTEQLYGVAEGPEAAVFTPIERAMLQAADEFIDHFRINDDTWAELAAELDSAQLLELLHVIGGYLALAGVVHSVGLRADPPTEPIDAPELPQEA